MALAPIYSVNHWKIKRYGDNGLRFRPGISTFYGRLLYLFAALIVILTVETAYRRIAGPGSSAEPIPIDPALASDIERSGREMLGDEEYERVQAETRARNDERRAASDDRRARVERIAWTVRTAVVGVALVAGLLPLIALAWNRVTVIVSPRGELTILSWYWIPRRRTWPKDAFEAVTVFVQHRRSAERIRFHARDEWVWSVQLRRHGQPGIPIVMNVAWSNEDLGPTFRAAISREDPGDGRRNVPGPVRELVRGLRSMLSVEAEGPHVIRTERGLSPGMSTTLFTDAQPVHSTTQTFRSLDEVPVHRRAEAESLLREALETGQSRVSRARSRITVRDAEGRERTYDSLDDLPPDVRRSLEAHRRQSPPRRE